ncbi:MAG: protein translocase subunit SecD [Christensenellaceae bacterium]|nr:protein translocase subunit SecD [Christensenellaceae bacterium]
MKKRKQLTKKSAIVGLCVALIFTIVIVYIGINGMWLDNRGLYKLLPWIPTTNVEGDNWPKSISLGLDLKGGVYVEYEAKITEELKGADFDLLLNSTIDVISNRLTDKGYPEATVVQLGSSGIRVEIPDVQDPNAILDLIGSPAKLEFLDPDGNVFMEGKHLKTAVEGKDENFNPAINFVLTDEGQKIFAEVTSKNIGKNLSIHLDGEELMSPTVQVPITGGTGIITGLGTEERAKTIATQIQSGALPLEITQQKVDTISATLGIDALAKATKAMALGIVLVMLIMILRYRVSGLVASWALIIYVALLFFLIAVIPGIQLTLPGIAGVVLSIGMAVDANVIIFERIGEELEISRPLKFAISIGFKNAMSAIIDSNVTTIIAAVVLFIFSTGSLKGFAITLFLGIVTSMFTALIISKFLLTRISTIFYVKNLYTSKKLVMVEEV